MRADGSEVNGRSMRELAERYMGGLAHVHTRLSNYLGHAESDQSMVSFVRELVARGLAGRADAPFGYVMFNDHASNPARPRRLGRYSLRARALLRSRRNFEFHGVSVMHGLEVSLLPDLGTDLTLQLAEWCVLVIASRHDLPAELTANPRAVEQMWVRACEDPSVDVLGHPARNIEGLRQVDWKVIFERAAATGTAVEVNLNNYPDPAREPARERFWRDWLAILAESGAAVFIGTDLHNVWQMQRFLRNWQFLERTPHNALAACFEALDEVGIGPERVVTAEYDGFCQWLALDKPARVRFINRRS